MNITTSPTFSTQQFDLGSGNELVIIDIEKIDSALESYIDQKFIHICEGHASANLADVKQRLIKFLSTKVGSTTEMGAIAEFFLHLYLHEQGYQPQFLFFNLEENSIKKGFDGYYFYNGSEWILESKSGLSTTQGMSHSGKVKESYEDLNNKLSGKIRNNPWRNAYNHASHIDVQANKNVRENIKKFTEDYDQEIYYNIEDFNIIPGATVFLDGNWVVSDAKVISDEVKEVIKGLKFKQINIVCITKKSLQIFWDYLKK